MHALFDGHRRQRNIDTTAVSAIQQEHTSFPRKWDRIANAGAIHSQKDATELVFIAKTRQQRDVYIAPDADLPPTLNRDPADHSGLPALRIAKCL